MERDRRSGGADWRPFEDGSWRPHLGPFEAVDEPGAVSQTVLDQALGSIRAPGENVIGAAFVTSFRGRPLRLFDEPSPQLVVVTGRRLIKVIAWMGPSLTETAGDLTMSLWRCGQPLGIMNRLARRYLWLGQIRDLKLRSKGSPPVARALVLHTASEGTAEIRARPQTVTHLHDAVREALAGPGAATVPPPTPTVPGFWSSWGRPGR